MKKLLQMTGVTLVAICMMACQKENNTPDPETVKTPQAKVSVFNAEKVDSYYATAQISVPAGVNTVYLVNFKGRDANGNMIDPKEPVAIQVEPVMPALTGNRDVEPFGNVTLFFESPAKTKVAVYYVIGDGAQEYVPAKVKADNEEDQPAKVYALDDFPVEKIEFGEFGKTRYVQLPWSFAYKNDESTGWQSVPTYPKDVVFYDKEHDHTLRYTFAYEGAGCGFGYVLTDAYTVENHVVTKQNYDYCGGCGSCPYCMPWSCSCGCGSVNPDFVGNGNQTASAGSDAIVVDPQTPGTTETGDGGRVTVDQYGTIIVDYAPYDVTSVKLTEPASYVSTDDALTAYHSSGVVMFEDSWPTVSRGNVYDTDFDDVVVDYDFETKIVPDEKLESDGWREQLKVVLHLRAVGSGYPYRVGVRMEGFDQQYVDYIDKFFTLDSYNNPHGELPKFTKETLQKMSDVYTNDPLNPVVEMAHLHRMNTKDYAGLGENAVYTYQNGSFTNTTVFNLTWGYKGKYENGAWTQNADWHESQYSPELKTMNLPYAFEKIMKQTYYNCIPGYINVSGGLLTFTVIFHMRSRADMSAEDREKAKQNMIDAVMNTQSQNFFIIADSQWTPVGLKGYSPVLVHNESVKRFNQKVQEGLDARYIESADNPYSGTNGMVWGFKCPTLTKHVWNKLYFSAAYPNYESWVTSKGAQHADWYYNNVDNRFLVCEW